MGGHRREDYRKSEHSVDHGLQVDCARDEMLSGRQQFFPLNRQRASATNDAPRYGTLVAGLLPSDKHTPTSEKVQIHDALIY